LWHRFCTYWSTACNAVPYSLFFIYSLTLLLILLFQNISQLQMHFHL
jgi:hypothetical protein